MKITIKKSVLKQAVKKAILKQSIGPLPFTSKKPVKQRVNPQSVRDRAVKVMKGRNIVDKLFNMIKKSVPGLTLQGLKYAMQRIAAEGRAFQPTGVNQARGRKPWSGRPQRNVQPRYRSLNTTYPVQNKGVDPSKPWSMKGLSTQDIRTVINSNVRTKDDVFGVIKALIGKSKQLDMMTVRPALSKILDESKARLDPMVNSYK